MIDLTEMNIMFTLNGEMLISDSGSEMAFKDIEIGEGKTLIFDFAHSTSGSSSFSALNLLLFSPFRFYSSLYSGPVTSWKD